MKTSSVSRIIASVVIAVAAVSALAGSKEDIQADMKAGRWSQADTRLTDVLAKHPDNALAHYWQAQVKFRENQLDEARKHLSAAKELDPQFKFASDKASLSKLEAALDKPVATPLPKIDNPAPRQTMPARVDTPPPAPYQEPKSSGGSGWLWIGLIVLAVFIFWAVRSAKSRGMSGDKAAIKGKLEEALNDLRDAGKFIDTRADLTMEQKLAMSDRVMRAQGDVQAHLATLATRDDLQPSIDLWRRVRDIAAETRGERRPSEIEAEREMELQRMRQTQMANQNMGMPNQGGGFGGTGAALGGLAAGVVLGSMMSGGAQAHERRDSGSGGGSGGYTPIEDFDRGDSSPSIDIGGSGDGGGWDSGGSDTGGGGSDSFD